MIEEGNQEIREDLKEEVTETYGLIGNLFKSVSFFLEVFSGSTLNFINFFSKKKK